MSQSPPKLVARRRAGLALRHGALHDGSGGLAAAARHSGVEHHAVNVSAGQRVLGAWHINNVNGYHSRLKNWLRRFNGVASSYLRNYLGWFRALDRSSVDGQKPAALLALAVGL